MTFRSSIARPVLSPVNASAHPLRHAPHDSRSAWFATPSLCDSFIHYAMPVSRRFRLFSAAPNGDELVLNKQFSHTHTLWQPFLSAPNANLKRPESVYETRSEWIIPITRRASCPSGFISVLLTLCLGATHHESASSRYSGQCCSWRNPLGAL